MKTVLALSLASMVALAVSGVSTPASARNGGAIAAGVVGGLAAGAIIGSQVNRSYYGGPAYVEGPAYISEPAYRPACHTERQEVTDAYGNYRIRRVRVCD
jgi:hypothetical protein